MHQDALCELLETVHEGKPTQLSRRFLSTRGKEIMGFENRRKNDHPVDPGYSRNGKVLGPCTMEQLASIIHEISEPATAVALNAKAVQLALASEPPDFVRTVAMNGEQNTSVLYTSFVPLGFVFRDSHAHKGSDEAAHCSILTTAKRFPVPF